VKKYLQGGQSNLNPEQYFIIYSLKDRGYRAINKQRIQRVALRGVVIYQKGE
jgi:hypothetical protein